MVEKTGGIIGISPSIDATPAESKPQATGKAFNRRVTAHIQSISALAQNLPSRFESKDEHLGRFSISVIPEPDTHLIPQKEAASAAESGQEAALQASPRKARVGVDRSSNDLKTTLGLKGVALNQQSPNHPALHVNSALKMLLYRYPNKTRQPRPWVPKVILFSKNA